MSIVYAREDNLGADEYIAVVKSSGLNRPVEDRARVERMLAQANLIVTAREDGRLVGTGSYDELIATCPTFIEIVQSQLAAEVPA